MLREYTGITGQRFEARVRSLRMPILLRCTCPISLLLAACGGVRTSTVPLTDTFVVEANADGQALRLMLDTGSTCSVMRPEAAQRLGLEPAPPPAGATATDSQGVTRTIAQFAHMRGLVLGTTTFRDFLVPVMPLTDWFPVDGILGMDWIGANVWIFDVPAARVTLLDESRLDAELAATARRIVARVPLRVVENKPFVTVQLQGTTDIELLLDTAAQHTNLPAKTIAALALRDGEPLVRRRAAEREARLKEAFEQQGVKVTSVTTTRTGTSVGLHGVSGPSGAPAWLDRLELGGVRFDDLCVYPRDEGLLGADVLGCVPFVFHGPRSEIWLLAAR